VAAISAANVVIVARIARAIAALVAALVKSCAGVIAPGCVGLVYIGSTSYGRFCARCAKHTRQEKRRFLFNDTTARPENQEQFSGKIRILPGF